MKKLLFLIVILFICATNSTYAQKKIVGLVTAANGGEPIAGATVQEKGTTNATMTSIDGTYSIRVKENSILVFSFIGMKKQEIAVNGKSEINVVMEDETIGVDEVVVTAMGIKREKKALNYAVQDVKGKELAETQQTNIADALAGRISGINVVNTSGDVGASTSIVIRGGTSLGGNNQPIFIVDGVPIDNTSVSTRDFDDINRAADIDPEDIASVSVLKGPSAAALYGINAAGGAIVITTKSGSLGDGQITYSNNFKFNVINNLPELQKTYQHGYNGVPHSSVFNSWGPPITSKDTIFDNLKNFFNTGFSQKHHINFSKSNKRGSYRFSMSRYDQKGVVPKSKYNSTSMRINTSRQIKQWLRVNASANYIHAESDKSSKGANGFYRQLLVYPINYDVEKWLNPDGSYASITGHSNYTDNPFFTVNKDRFESKTNRIISNASLVATPIEGLSFTTRIGSDFYTTRGHSYIMPGNTIPDSKDGRLSEFQRTSHVLNGTFLTHYERNLMPDLNLSVLLGSSLEDYDYWSDYRRGTQFKNPDFIGISNVDANSIKTTATRVRRRRAGLFGELKLDYKNMVYLGITGRNDWSSTLPKDNNSFFYPSYSLGFIFSELLDDKSIISYGKVRASWSEVGKDAPPYIVGTSMFVNDRSGGGFYNGYSGGNPFLKPETTTSFEIGLDLRLLKGRVNFDLTYYNQKSKDMIINPRLSYATGYILFYMNGGVISNKGYELQAKLIPIKNKQITWDIILNYSQNEGILESMPYPIEEYYEAATWVYGNIRNGAKPGEAYSGLTGFDYKKTDDGRVIVDKDGIPIREAKYVTVGDREPDFILGITNTLQYKRFRLSCLLDIRVGGDVFNGTKAYLCSRGADKLTEQRGRQIIVDGVVEMKDSKGNITYQKNTKPIKLDRNFFQYHYCNVESNFIEHVNLLRIRNISLSYKFDTKRWNRMKFIKDLSLSFTGYNLALWTNYTGADPEVNTLGAGARGSGGAGIDYGVMPATTAYSLGLKVKF